MTRSPSWKAASSALLTAMVTLNLCGCALGSCGQEAASPMQTDGPPAVPPCASLDECTPPVPACTGTGAAAGTLASTTDPHLIGGPGAGAMAGDYYLQNDKVRFVIQKPGRIFSTVPTGGNIIDADLVRAAGEPGDDELGELTGFISGVVYPVVDTLEVKQDGSAGGPAVIQGDAHFDVLEYMNLAAILGDNPDFKTLAPDMAANADKLISSLEARVTYVLCPGEPLVRIRYTLFDKAASNAAPLKASVGTFLSGAGQSGAFMSGFGFGPRGAGDGFTQRKPGNIFGLWGKSVAYAQRPYLKYDAYLNPSDYWDPEGGSSQVTISGLSITAFGEPLPAAMLGPNSANHPMELKAQTGSTFEVLFGLGRDLAEAEAAVSQDRGLGQVSGTVTSVDGIPAGTRVAVFGPDLMDATKTTIQSSFGVAADGTYGGQLLPGTYTFEVDAPGRPRKQQSVTVSADTPATVPPFSLDPTRTISYHVTAGGQPTACRVSVITNVATANAVRSNNYRDTLQDPYPPGLAYVVSSSVCDSDSTAPGAAGPLEVVPGTYRVVVSHGPEFSIVDQRAVDLTTPASTNITGDLVRAMNTDGWAAIDLHQHAWFSFDSRFPHEQRLTAYLAEGLDFFGASEHDRVFDYTDLIAQMGYQDRLATMTGTEISPMHYGHFNAFELVEDKHNPVNGGAPDWSGGPNTTVVTPDNLLGMAMNAGADLISANHPRAPDGWTYFYWWDRCGLEVDFATGTVGCSPDLQAVPDDLLDITAGDTLWTTKWDLLEMFNRPTPICRRLGYDTHPTDGGTPPVIPVKQGSACSADGATMYWCDPNSADGGRTFDAQVDQILKDYLNMLQVGFIRTVVGNSDSHKLVGEIAGTPRSYVNVGSGHDRADDPNLKTLLKKALKPDLTATPPRLAGAVIAGNGPFVTVTVVGDNGGPTSGGIGQVVADSDGTVDVQVHIEAPDWLMGAGRIEVFANDSFDIYSTEWVKQYSPSWRGDTTQVEPLLAPSDRTLEFTATDWTVAGGHRFIDRTLTVTPVADATRDAWIVVRVTGDKPMYPVLPDGACFKPTDDPAQAGVEPFFGTTAIAVTNPVFVLRNGHTTWKAPAAP